MTGLSLTDINGDFRRTALRRSGVLTGHAFFLQIIVNALQPLYYVSDRLTCDVRPLLLLLLLLLRGHKNSTHFDRQWWRIRWCSDMGCPWQRETGVRRVTLVTLICWWWWRGSFLLGQCAGCHSSGGVDGCNRNGNYSENEIPSQSGPGTGSRHQVHSWDTSSTLLMTFTDISPNF